MMLIAATKYSLENAWRDLQIPSSRDPTFRKIVKLKNSIVLVLKISIFQQLHQEFSKNCQIFTSSKCCRLSVIDDVTKIYNIRN